MKKSVTVRTVCLVLALVVLTGAVAYAAVTGSPYGALKKALLDAATYRNATEESDVTLTVNGQLTQSRKTFVVNGDNGYMQYYFDKNGETRGYYYATDGLGIERPVDLERDGKQWYRASSLPSGYYYKGGGMLTMFSPEERGSAQMRFIELAIDALVGDLKNNITMTSENGVRHVRGTLTESQMPELVKAGVDMLAEQSGGRRTSQKAVSFDGSEYVYELVSIEQGVKTVTVYRQAVTPMTAEERSAWEDGTLYDDGSKTIWGAMRSPDGTPYIMGGPPEIIREYTAPVTPNDFIGEDPLNIPMKSLVVNYVHGEADIDDNGNLLGLDVGAAATMTDIFGQVSDVEIKLTAKYSDIGTSEPVCPIPGAEQLLTADYFRAMFGGDKSGSVWFTLNPNGGIDAGSLTTKYPQGSNRPAVSEYMD